MRKVSNILVAVVITLVGVGAWECGAAPESQCQTGSTKATRHGGKTRLYECHSNTWVEVTCYNGTTKTETRDGRVTHWVCRSGSWVKQ